MEHTMNVVGARRATNRVALIVTLLLLVVSASAALASSASANSQNFCGRVIASTVNNATGFNCNGSDSYWSYASASYGGGGNDLDWLRAAVVNNGSVVNGQYAKVNHLTFASICYGNVYSFYGHGNVGQTSGANHTISGHVDDSTGHSGCVGP